MQITPFLQRVTFPPETRSTVAAAFADVCRALGVHDQNDPLATLIAEHIVAASRRGIRTKVGLYFDAVLAFKSHPQIVARSKPVHT